MPWQMLPNKPQPFFFTNALLIGLPKTKVGFLPCPEDIINSENLFIRYSWDIFWGLGSMINKRLEDKYPEGFGEENSGLLFSFSFALFQNPPAQGIFTLTIEKDWVAEVLDFPHRTEGSNKKNCPWKALHEIMAKLKKRQ